MSSRKLINILNKAALIFKLNKQNIPLLISNITDAELWYKDVNINPRRCISKKFLENVLNILFKTQILSNDLITDIENFIDKRISKFE